MDVQFQIVFVGVPALLVGLLIWAQLRANDRRAAERHRALVDALQRTGRGAQTEIVAMGPESSRRVAYLPFVVTGDLGEDHLDVIAAELCPSGPRPACEIVGALGWKSHVADMPPEQPVYLVAETRVVLYRDDERSERSLLEGAAAVALGARNLRVDPVNVSALVRRLSRPVPVRSAEV